MDQKLLSQPEAAYKRCSDCLLSPEEQRKRTEAYLDEYRAKNNPK